MLLIFSFSIQPHPPAHLISSEKLANNLKMDLINLELYPLDKDPEDKEYVKCVSDLRYLRKSQSFFRNRGKTNFQIEIAARRRRNVAQLFEAGGCRRGREDDRGCEIKRLENGHDSQHLPRRRRFRLPLLSHPEQKSPHYSKGFMDGLLPKPKIYQIAGCLCRL